MAGGKKTGGQENSKRKGLNVPKIPPPKADKIVEVKSPGPAGSPQITGCGSSAKRVRFEESPSCDVERDEVHVLGHPSLDLGHTSLGSVLHDGGEECSWQLMRKCFLDEDKSVVAPIRGSELCLKVAQSHMQSLTWTNALCDEVTNLMNDLKIAKETIVDRDAAQEMLARKNVVLEEAYAKQTEELKTIRSRQEQHRKSHDESNAKELRYLRLKASKATWKVQRKVLLGKLSGLRGLLVDEEEVLLNLKERMVGRWNMSHENMICAFLNSNTYARMKASHGREEFLGGMKLAFEQLRHLGQVNEDFDFNKLYSKNDGTFQACEREWDKVLSSPIVEDRFAFASTPVETWPHFTRPLATELEEIDKLLGRIQGFGGFEAEPGEADSSDSDS